MKKLYKIVFYFLAILFISCSQNNTKGIYFREKQEAFSNYQVPYKSGNWKHPDYGKPFEFNGNHRAVVEVKSAKKENVEVYIPWRRRDDNPDQKDVVIVDAKTNQVVKNRKILESNNEFGRLVFQTNENSSLYYIYYLAHISTGSYYPKLHYKKPTTTGDTAWLNSVNISNDQLEKLRKATVLRMESIDDFNSFFPMEIIATGTETSQYVSAHPKPFYTFPEYREYPIKMVDFLPYRWMRNSKDINGISDTALKGEYYTFQVGIFSPTKNLENVQIDFSDFTDSDGNTISKENSTCFNSGGIDLNGKAFKKSINVPANKTQALWFGVQVPETAKAGNYLGHIIIQPANTAADTVYVQLKVSDKTIANHGDDTPQNMSRLRWLNSTLGTDKDAIIKPFIPVSAVNKKLHILGRDIELNAMGLPKQISSYFTQEMTHLKTDNEPLLSQPIQFDVFNKNGTKVAWKSAGFEVKQIHKSAANWTSSNSSDNFLMTVSGTLEYDGMLDYKISLIAKKSTKVKDIKLQIPIQKATAKYMLGLGKKGGEFKDIRWKWDVKKNQEGAWLGTINKGLQYVLRDNNYERPLNTNFYQTKPLNLPPSWYNDHKGGINILTKGNTVVAENYSGARTIKKGDTLHFNVRFLITPFKTIDIKAHFNTRFVHKYLPIDSVIKLQGTVVNVHHANEINPYINYPFYNLKKQKAYIAEAHQKGIKVKLYNTIRELSYKAYELFPLKSLNSEILNDGKAGGHSWLQEHLKSNYYAAWHATSVNDAAILDKGNSRWTNYYIEGINWSAKNQKIDGLYLDDIAFSRATVKRIANVFTKARGTYIIDLHSANQFNYNDGFINSAFLYMEHFPYITRLWFGEYFDYNSAPDYWFTEVSGLPFGLTGEMLEKGGQPFRGLVYGMTTRVYGDFNPGAIWKLFKEFDIANSTMLGYWVDTSPIKTNHKNIKSTVYLHKDKVLIAIGSWSAKDESVNLLIDWKKLGFDKNNARLTSPAIDGMQLAKKFDINSPILVPKNKGIVLILEKKIANHNNS